MSRSLHLSANALFGAAFLVGLSCVWTGLSALVLGHGGPGVAYPRWPAVLPHGWRSRL